MENYLKSTQMEGLNKDNLWQGVASELQVSISPASYTSWIKPCFIDSVTEIDGERVLIELATPSVFHQRTVDERYYGQIKQVIEKQTGKRCELAMVVRQREVKEEKRETNGLMDKNLFDDSAIKEQSEDDLRNLSLNPRFSFDNFVVGSSNNLAYAAAKAVVDNPGRKHNPFFIWGGVGVGKTHLMHAIARELLKKGKSEIKMVTSEQFTNEFISTMRNKTVDSFKKKYRNVEALMIDDIQFLAGKESTQEEFFHTFNELYAKGAQIVMTSDRRPQDIEQVEQRLISRFLGGLTVDIGLPDYEMRVAILKQKSEEQNLDADEEAINLIASSLSTNVRELEGTLMRMASMATLKGTRLTTEVVEAELGSGGIAPKTGKRMRPQEVISVICKKMGLKNKDVVGKSRKAEIVKARHIAMYILREEMGIQLVRVAKLMGRNDHTTVMHAVEKIKGEFNTDQEVREQVMEVKQIIYKQ